MKGMRLILIVLMALPLLSAIEGVDALRAALSSLCSGLTSMLPVAGMLMTLLAAVIYASGQMMGAETRARANVWATAALTGAMMAVLIAVVAPSALGIVYGGTITCTGSMPLPPTCTPPNSQLCWNGVQYSCIPSGNACPNPV